MVNKKLLNRMKLFYYYQCGMTVLGFCFRTDNPRALVILKRLVVALRSCRLTRETKSVALD